MSYIENKLLTENPPVKGTILEAITTIRELREHAKTLRRRCIKLKQQRDYYKQRVKEIECGYSE